MASIIYGLCALTSLLCAFLLLRAFAISGTRVLLWSGLCFCGLTGSNLLLVLDKLVFPQVDLLPWRYFMTLLSLTLLLYGLLSSEE